ncbi:hypothetical protein JCM8547_009241 [Rhodosporidiobolus lusitaniae]
MLDRLPNELLSHVVGLGAPLDYAPSFYLERRQFLRDICLVSKRMRDVAQPMLFEVYEVKMEDNAKWLEEVDNEGRTRASKVKLLVPKHLYLSGDPATNAVLLQGLLVQCAAVVELRLIDAGDIDLDWLAPLTHLRHLISQDERTRLQSTATTTFPNLLEFSACLVRLKPALLTTFPSPSTAPSFQTLVLC